MIPAVRNTAAIEPNTDAALLGLFGKKPDVSAVDMSIHVIENDMKHAMASTKNEAFTFKH